MKRPAGTTDGVHSPCLHFRLFRLLRPNLPGAYITIKPAAVGLYVALLHPVHQFTESKKKRAALFYDPLLHWLLLQLVVSIMRRVKSSAAQADLGLRLISYLEARLQCYGPRYTFLLCYLCANLILFCHGAVGEHAKWSPDKFVAWNGVFSRGFGSILNFNFALSIILSSKSVISILRNTVLSTLFPLDDAIPGMHSLVGLVAFTASLLHGIFHSIILKKVDRWEPGFGGFTWCFITGWVLLALTLVLVVSAIRPLRKRCFEFFRRLHQICAAISIPLLLIHGFHNGKARTYQWLVGPLLIYCVDLFLRMAKSHAEVRVELDPNFFNVAMYGRIVRLAVPKQFEYQAGQYAELCIPALSTSQWHPFTIASSPEESDFIFFIKRNGDWTAALHQICSSGWDEKANAPISSLDLKIRGPFGAPAQHSGQYDRILLISGGVGATPFCSITKHVNKVISQQGKNSRQSRIPQAHQSSSGYALDLLNRELPAKHSSLGQAHVPNISDMGMSIGRPTVSEHHEEHQEGPPDLGDVPFRYSCKRSSPESAQALPRTWGEIIYILCCTVIFNALLLWTLLIRFACTLFAVVFEQVDIGALGTRFFPSRAPDIIDFSLASIFAAMLLFSSLTEFFVENLFYLEDILFLLPAASVPVVIHVLGEAHISLDNGHFARYNLFIVWPVLLTLALWRYFRTLGGTAFLSDSVRHSHHSTKSVDFLWTTPTREDDEWLMEELSRSLRPTRYVRLHRFITQESQFDIESGLDARGFDGCHEMYAEEGLRTGIQYGRPQWDLIFGKLTRKLKSGSTVGIFFCGPPAMGIEVRRAAMRSMIESRQRGLQYRGRDRHVNTEEPLRSFNIRYVFREEKFT